MSKPPPDRSHLGSSSFDDRQARRLDIIRAGAALVTDQLIRFSIDGSRSVTLSVLRDQLEAPPEANHSYDAILLQVREQVPYVRNLREEPRKDIYRLLDAARELMRFYRAAKRTKRDGTTLDAKIETFSDDVALVTGHKVADEVDRFFEDTAQFDFEVSIGIQSPDALYHPATFDQRQQTRIERLKAARKLAVLFKANGGDPEIAAALGFEFKLARGVIDGVTPDSPELEAHVDRQLDGLEVYVQRTVDPIVNDLSL